jgi:hypothetical protein
MSPLGSIPFKSISIAAALLATAAIGTWRSWPKAPAGALHREAPSSDDLSSLKQEVGILRSLVQSDLRERLEASAGARQEERRTASADDSVAETVPPTPEAIEEHLEQAKRRSEARTSYIQRIFDGQVRDRQWAGETEDGVRAAFRDDLPGSSVARIECRSTMCELLVEHVDPIARERFNTLFPRLVPALPSGTLIRSETQDGKPITRAFLMRPGAQIPEPPESELISQRP